MNIRNRMADVVKLRCNACQDFIRLYLKDGWQEQLYRKAEYEVRNSTKFRDKYVATYEKMRDIGIANYSVDNMDVTLIAQLLIAKFQDLNSVQKETRLALLQIKDDRNLTNHSDENEIDEELYLRALLALTNLRQFIRTVDKYEVSIDDSIRLAFRQKYITKIDDLKAVLDNERIELIYYIKKVDKDIDRILYSNDILKAWCNIEKLYIDRYMKTEKEQQKFFDFEVRASDRGIFYAHAGASNYFSLIKKDYVEAERRLHMLFNQDFKFNVGDVHNFLSALNLIPRSSFAPNTMNMIEKLRQMGFTIEEDKFGQFHLPNKKRQ